MGKPRSSQCLIVRLAVIAIALAGPAYADQLVYTSLAQPCRLLDTRTSTGGPGPLTAGNPYLFGTDNTSISSAVQHGSSTGCAVPSGVAAVSVNMNMINATAAGNIATWNPDSGATAPNIGTGVYNPSVSSPAAGQVVFNTGYSSIPVGSASGSNPGRFYLKVANGQIDMTINVVGYWHQVSWGETISGSNAIALGYQTTASGGYSTALGQNTVASNYAATAIGYLSQATSNASFAAGQDSLASGYASVAMGYQTQASGSQATAFGYQTWARDTGTTALGYRTSSSGVGSLATGQGAIASGAGSFATGNSVEALGNYSIAMGSYAGANTNGSFVFCDLTCTNTADIVLSTDNYFAVLASGGASFITSAATASPRTGVYLNAGSGSWGGTSDRNAKTAEQQIDVRDVLARVVAMPVTTWQYKTQDAKYRHMGPMAQDFYAAFHLGERDTIIDTIDEDGVALAAIQGLKAELGERDREIAALRAELAKQNSHITSLESLAGKVAQLEAKLDAIHEPMTTTVAARP